ncbi:heterodisulfide reductase subunit C [Sulfuriferula plumbiphila]|uniref:Heterodisulfide reductase subunit C n=1 Tax=Sulfuriferula plumbiphila TaxID=171865 RepID=A0A512L3Z7_9PROT|nr:4Fe-4S dicluster domain-containing protein [Sulfuriferula plumbiphila]BBP05521.1 heterodisulfide reductase subunit C [Sulfuriferula plumbiphila]GEP29182.1 heterodisulfide reductase subunit C [Sulfuriferula plumbiphila]
MAIHEKTLIDADRLITSDKLVVDGVDVSGHWNTMILPRTLKDYDDDFETKIKTYSGAENVHRCWQCGSCTNSCTMYAQNTDFNPRYWIYLVRLGLKDELLKDKDIIWQCVSCNKCTNICPKDVRPEGVMKALAHWIEEEGYGSKSNSSIFDEEFTRQCLERGRIEDSEVMSNFFKNSKQDMMQMALHGWLGIFVARMNKWTELRQGNVIRFLSRTPIMHSLHMGLSMFFKPKTKSWGRTGDVLKQYVKEQKELAHG